MLSTDQLYYRQTFGIFAQISIWYIICIFEWKFVDMFTNLGPLTPKYLWIFVLSSSTLTPSYTFMSHSMSNAEPNNLWPLTLKSKQSIVPQDIPSYQVSCKTTKRFLRYRHKHNKTDDPKHTCNASGHFIGRDIKIHRNRKINTF